MRFFRLAWLAVFLSALQPSLFAQSAEPWRPVTPQDLSMTAVKESPGAPAVRLYYSYFKDDNAGFVSEYIQIKILTQAGLKYADAEIPLDPRDSIKELKARTIHPDGTIIDFTGKPFEKTIVKGHGIKYLAKTLTLPNVTVGSIVEYSYVKIWY